MSNKLWRAKWQRNDIAFHQREVNPLLKQFFKSLHLPRHCRILVPLCGKSLDMDFLADRGHHVVGVELSPLAIKAYFAAREVNPSREKVGQFTRWRHKNTEIWCGDIFDLSRKNLEHNTLVYDCASLSAFPEEQRSDYVQHFYERLPENCQIMLATTETPDPDQANSQFSIDREVSSLYRENYEVRLLHGRTRTRQDPQQPEAPHRLMEEKLYQIRMR